MPNMTELAATQAATQEAREAALAAFRRLQAGEESDADREALRGSIIEGGLPDLLVIC